MSDSESRTIRLDVPSELVDIVRKLEDAGHSAWAVGGGVRDAIAGNVPEDWDVATSARPRQVQRLFRRTVPIGIEHGTVGVLTDSGKMYEVTTFRRDVETFGRKARVRFSDSLEEDLERRDFTINAVAWHPLTLEVRDPQGGVADLRRGVLRTVGDPRARFEEDRLRVLRALRFAGRFDLRIDSPTLEAAKAAADDLRHLSAERIREELWKVLSGQEHPSKTLRLYGEIGVLRAWYPELEACRGCVLAAVGGDSWEYLLRSVDQVGRRHPLTRLAALLHGLAFPTSPDITSADTAAASAAAARSLLQRLRSSNAHVDRVTHLVAQHTPLPERDATDPVVRRWLRRIGRDHVEDLFRLLFAIHGARPGGLSRDDLLDLEHRSERLLTDGTPLSISELAIGGNELRKAGVRPGPRYGEILRELLERVTDRPELNEPPQLLAIVEELERSPDSTT